MLKVNDIMTTDVFALNEEHTLSIARSLMENKHIRHIPVTDGNKNFVGLITHRDLLACSISLIAEIDQHEQDELDGSIRIKDVLKTDITTCNKDLDLCSAIKILLENKYGCLPVVLSGKLVGIVTEADFLKLTYDLLKNQEA